MKFFIQQDFLKVKDKTYEETLKMFAYSLAVENNLDLAIQIAEGYLTLDALKKYIKSWKNKDRNYYFTAGRVYQDILNTIPADVTALSRFKNLIMEEK